MKKNYFLIFFIALSGSIFALPIIGDRLVLERPGKELPNPVNENVLYISIKEALQRSSVGRVKWLILEDKTGQISTQLYVSDGKHTADVDILYTNEGYTFIHIGSHNLEENNRRTRIHSNYNEWVENLNDEIYLTYMSKIQLEDQDTPAEQITGEKKTVAVMSFKVSEGEDADLGDVISDLFSSELVDTRSFNVVTRTNIGSLMEELKFQASDLSTEDNAVAIGEMTNADFVVVGTVSKLGSLFVLQVHLIDVMTGQIESGAKETFASIEEVVDIMKPLVQDLID